jgi:hypothetical protein
MILTLVEIRSAGRVSAAARNGQAPDVGVSANAKPPDMGALHHNRLQRRTYARGRIANAANPTRKNPASGSGTVWTLPSSGVE